MVAPLLRARAGPQADSQHGPKPEEEETGLQREGSHPQGPPTVTHGKCVSFCKHRDAIFKEKQRGTWKQIRQQTRTDSQPPASEQAARTPWQPRAHASGGGNGSAGGPVCRSELGGPHESARTRKGRPRRPHPEKRGEGDCTKPNSRRRSQNGGMERNGDSGPEGRKEVRHRGLVDLPSDKQQRTSLPS